MRSRRVALCIAGFVAALSVGERPRSASADANAPSSSNAGETGSPANAGAIARSPASPNAPASPTCGGQKLVVRTYDVGQGLAALVELPDGRHVLVDAGDSPKRMGCGSTCAAASAHLVDRLRADLHGAPIDLLWITHPHSDHIGGAPEVLDAFDVAAYADNGRDGRKREVRRARSAAARRGAAVYVVDPARPRVPLADSPSVKLTAIVPPSWPASCARDANECSIGLRIDYCASSVVFMGDAEHDEEAQLDVHGPVTLLQVAHHGSETSTTPGFLVRARPRYAVISSGRPGQGLNAEYCHPRAGVVERLTRVLGGPTSKSLAAFDGDRCDRATPSDWKSVPTSDRLWATARDGDVTLATSGDGVFVPP